MRSRMSVLACILLSVPGAVFAEGFGVIDDPDGWVNVRKGASTRSDFVAKIDSGEMVWIYEEVANDWVKVVYLKGKEEIETTGFIHGSRIKRLDAMVEVRSKVENERRIVFSWGNVKVEVESQPFDATEHKFTRDSSIQKGDWGRLIDGEPFWGTDGGIPREEYKSIRVTSGEIRISLPDGARKNLFEPNFDNGLTYVVVDAESGAIYLVGSNSDGAGAYVVAFRFEGGEFKGRTVLAPY